MKADSDTTYMAAFRDGDQDAFRVLFEKYKKKIVNYCYRFCADRAIAEELAQEVFLRVYKAAPRYRPTARFSTWIFRIATNICLNELRKRQYRYRVESIDHPVQTEKGSLAREIQDTSRPMPLDQLEDRERDRFVQKAMMNLPEKQRAALLLRLYYGFSYREISSQIRASESSVKSLIHRGRQNLRQALGVQLGGE